MLKGAIQAAHAGSQNSARLTRALACAVVDLGLQPRGPRPGFGFRLVPVTFTTVGCQIATVKKNSSRATSSISTIIDSLYLQHFFSYAADAKSEKHLTMHIERVLPHADANVRSLLPDVAWKGKGGSAAATQLVAKTVPKQISTAPQKPREAAGPQLQAMGEPLPHTATGADSVQAGEEQDVQKGSTLPGSGLVPSLQVQATVLLHCSNPRLFSGHGRYLGQTKSPGSLQSVCLQACEQVSYDNSV